jgi:hypothetical protein
MRLHPSHDWYEQHVPAGSSEKAQAHLALDIELDPEDQSDRVETICRGCKGILPVWHEPTDVEWPYLECEPPMSLYEYEVQRIRKQLGVA